MKTHLFRVKPGKELSGSILEYCREQGIKSGIILGVIGSLSSARLGFLKELPGKYTEREFPGPLETVSAQGSIARFDGEVMAHIHILVSDENRSVGGHLIEGRVFSTAEVAILETGKIERYLDSHTGLKELKE